MHAVVTELKGSRSEINELKAQQQGQMAQQQAQMAQQQAQMNDLISALAANSLAIQQLAQQTGQIQTAIQQLPLGQRLPAQQCGEATAGELPCAPAEPRKPLLLSLILSLTALRQDKAEMQVELGKLRRAAASAGQAAESSGSVAYTFANVQTFDGDTRTRWGPYMRWQSWQGAHAIRGATRLLDIYRDGFEGILLNKNKGERTLSIFELEARRLQNHGKPGAISWRNGFQRP